MRLIDEMKYEYGFRLLGSAREFVASAVTRAEEHGSFNWYPSSEWKFAVVHLATALELLLKARIAIKDPLLLGAKGTISVADLESGRFRSVRIEVALRRLKQLGLVLTDEQRAALESVSDLRNRLVHFTIEEDRARFMSVFASGLNLFFELEFSEFRNVESYRAKTQSELIIQLAKVEAFVQERLFSLQPHLASSKRPRTHYFDECHHCLQDATIINDDGLCCLFCRHMISIPAYAEDTSEDGSVEACPDCGRGSVVRRRRRDGVPPTSECFCCGYFEGPELGWSDGKRSIPRLHGDRTAG
jgi:hypothetical protein